MKKFYSLKRALDYVKKMEKQGWYIQIEECEREDGTSVYYEVDSWEIED